MFEADAHLINQMMLRKYYANESKFLKLLNGNMLVMFVTAERTYFSMYSNCTLILNSVVSYNLGIDSIEKYLYSRYGTLTFGSSLFIPDLTFFISETFQDYLNRFSNLGLTDLDLSNVLLVYDNEQTGRYIFKTLTADSNLSVTWL